MPNEKDEPERKFTDELSMLVLQREKASQSEKGFYDKAINSLVSQLRILNRTYPGILDRVLAGNLSFLKTKEEREEEIRVRQRKLKKYEKPSSKPVRIETVYGVVEINKEDREKFLHDLNTTEEIMKKLKKTLETTETKKRKVSVSLEYSKPNPFVAFSSRFFSSLSLKLAEKGFKDLHKNLRKAGMPFLLNSYISMMLLSTLIAFIVGITGATAVTFITTTQNLPLSLVKNIAISFVLPVITFILFFVYPSSQVSSIKSKIDDELPFASMHMATIAGSGVEPVRVFKILALGDDYPNFGKEARKIINLINFYGYDLVNALRTTAKTTSSERLADLLNGMATIIASGGNLRSYLDKNSQDALLDYKLRREKYTEASGTYADVYTGLLVAAPLFFMLLLALINVIGISGISVSTMGIIGLGVIIALNIGFLIFLNVSQPET